METTKVFKATEGNTAARSSILNLPGVAEKSVAWMPLVRLGCWNTWRDGSLRQMRQLWLRLGISVEKGDWAPRILRWLWIFLQISLLFVTPQMQCKVAASSNTSLSGPLLIFLQLSAHLESCLMFQFDERYYFKKSNFLFFLFKTVTFCFIKAGFRVL